jgi:DMSO/TMAO reductase YedYZ heme-binding membrane subunit
VVGHLAFLATDRYAGVGWSGALIPGASHYRQFAVGLGVVALDLMVVIAATARLAGRRGARHWLAFHRLALAVFALVWVHGVLAGIDVAVLRPMYLLTGALVASLAVTRRFAAAVSGRPPAAGPTPDAPVEPPAGAREPLAVGSAPRGAR